MHAIVFDLDGTLIASTSAAGQGRGGVFGAAARAAQLDLGGPGRP